jgi:hypothetical protein
MPERFRLRVVQHHLGPAPGWFMKDRVLGRIPLRLSTEIETVESVGSRARLHLCGENGARERLEVDHIIAATGYRVDVERLTFLEQSLRAQLTGGGRALALGRNFESRVPGLYLVGLASAASFGPLARFAYGAGFTARRLAKHLARAHAALARGEQSIPAGTSTHRA